MPRSTYRLFACFVAFAAAGCGSAGVVTGKVTLNNQPVDRADLVFELTTDRDERYIGLSNDAGDYIVDYRAKRGLPAGRYRVLVTRYSLPGGKPLPAGEQGSVLKQTDKAVRDVYAFEVDIVHGANKHDFELSQGKKEKSQ